MTVAQIRGGIPRVFRDTITTTGRKHRLKFYTSYLVARNKGANVIRMYFTETDFTDNANYVELPVSAATEPFGEWSGPVEAEDIWFRGVSGSSDVELVTFQRRG